MSENMENTNNKTVGKDFIRDRIDKDLSQGKIERVVTRFPPEPNGQLHIGHAKAVCLNFSIAGEYPGSRCHLRFDDTNPVKEDDSFVQAIKRDIQWLGWDWGDHLYFASDYYQKLYEFALQLIRDGKAYVCHLSAEQTREYRGTLKEPGQDSPFRNRSVEENLTLFQQMKNGDLAEGECVLRAKIDMASPNITLRDPTIYRIRKVPHHRTGTQWCIYPMYDFAHCLSDALEGITHSLCSLEFENNRPLYDWFIEQVGFDHRPQQIEFARMNLTYVMTSKRKLAELIQRGYVEGWDDPRMPTLSGLRRRGVTPFAIRDYCNRIGMAKANSTVDMALFEHCIREELNQKATRVMAVLDPIKVVITNYPEDQSEELEAVNNPEDPSAGTRMIPFARELFIERDDFMEDPPKKFFRLGPGREVRLRYAYFITCHEIVRDPESGKVLELHCTYDPLSKGGKSPDGRKVKGTIHWVSANHAIDAEVRLFEHLFTVPDPDAQSSSKDLGEILNHESKKVLKQCKLEPFLADCGGQRYQFERLGYFWPDPEDSKKNDLVFNRISSLRDTWAKVQETSQT